VKRRRPPPRIAPGNLDELAVALLLLRLLARLFRCGLFPFGLFGFDDVDAHLAEHGSVRPVEQRAGRRGLGTLLLGRCGIRRGLKRDKGRTTKDCNARERIEAAAISAVLVVILLCPRNRVNFTPAAASAITLKLQCGQLIAAGGCMGTGSTEHQCGGSRPKMADRAVGGR
jgi:hypothetical protein